MILDNTSLTLQAVLSAVVSANQPEVHVNYIIYNSKGEVTKPFCNRTALNSTTDVTILEAPTIAGYVHKPINITIYNKDTSSITVTIKTDDGITERIIVKQIVSAGGTLCWDESEGWYTI